MLDNIAPLSPQGHSAANLALSRIPSMASVELSRSSGQSRPIEEPYATLPPNGTGKRKGHRKSRAGCFGCKRKKIKCQETRPACKNCLRSGIDCCYPTDQPDHDPATSSSISLSPSSTFSLDDMRYFHHFLTMAYPHLPLGTGHAWLHEIPTLAHHYDFLMNSILSLGSCHLDYMSGNRRDQEADRRRFLAIKGLNEAFSRGQRLSHERDAMLATCYALTFASAYHGDSLGDFLTLVRGCGTMTHQLQASKTKSVLVPENQKLHLDFMRERLRNTPLPKIREKHIFDALASLTAVRPLCMDERAAHLVEAMTKTVALCQTSSLDAYFSFIRIYADVVSMSHEDFTYLTDTTNSVSQILQGHFLAVEALVSPFLSREANKDAPHVPGRLSHKSIRHAYDACVPFAQEYLTWPLEFCESIALAFPNTESFICSDEWDEGLKEEEEGGEEEVVVLEQEGMMNGGLEQEGMMKTGLEPESVMRGGPEQEGFAMEGEDWSKIDGMAFADWNSTPSDTWLSENFTSRASSYNGDVVL